MAHTITQSRTSNCISVRVQTTRSDLSDLGSVAIRTPVLLVEDPARREAYCAVSMSPSKPLVKPIQSCKADSTCFSSEHDSSADLGINRRDLSPDSSPMTRTR